jgi:hypothetical protein
MLAERMTSKLQVLTVLSVIVLFTLVPTVFVASFAEEQCNWFRSDPLDCSAAQSNYCPSCRAPLGVPCCDGGHSCYTGATIYTVSQAGCNGEGDYRETGASSCLTCSYTMCCTSNTTLMACCTGGHTGMPNYCNCAGRLAQCLDCIRCVPECEFADCEHTVYALCGACCPCGG